MDNNLRNNMMCHDTRDDLEEEQNNFLSILAAFKHYRAYSMSRVDKTETYLNTLPDHHQDMLTHYRQHLHKIRHCIDENAQIIRRIIQNVDRLFDNQNRTIVAEPSGHQIGRVRTVDLDKVQVTLKQFVRDWSHDGAEERAQCYKPIIDAVVKYFGEGRAQRDPGMVRILVPGAGLGRLTYEFARRGFHCEGNEFSLFMLIASNFVLNKCAQPDQYTIYPWVHGYVNHLKRADQVRPSTFPDVSPLREPPRGQFNMVAGDFLQVYRQHDEWECVATCFFIDCANNVAEFVENIYNILKPGGIWVNLGPLLYHYSDVEFEGSIEPTYEDLIAVIRAMGFQILQNDTNVRTKYAQNPRSMQQSEYLSAFFVCRKPSDDDEECPAARAQQEHDALLQQQQQEQQQRQQRLHQQQNNASASSFSLCSRFRNGNAGAKSTSESSTTADETDDTPDVIPTAVVAASESDAVAAAVEPEDATLNASTSATQT